MQCELQPKPKNNTGPTIKTGNHQPTNTMQFEFQPKPKNNTGPTIKTETINQPTQCNLNFNRNQKTIQAQQ